MTVVDLDAALLFGLLCGLACLLSTQPAQAEQRPAPVVLRLPVPSAN